MVSFTSSFHTQIIPTHHRHLQPIRNHHQRTLLLHPNLSNDHHHHVLLQSPQHILPGRRSHGHNRILRYRLRRRLPLVLGSGLLRRPQRPADQVRLADAGRGEALPLHRRRRGCWWLELAKLRNLLVGDVQRQDHLHPCRRPLRCRAEHRA